MAPCHFETNSDQMSSKSLPGLFLDKAAQMMRGYANVLRDRVESKVWVGVRTFQVRERHSNARAHLVDRRLANEGLDHFRRHPVPEHRNYELTTLDRSNPHTRPGHAHLGSAARRQ